MPNSDHEARAKQYSTLSGISINFASLLGEGTDGKVWKSSRGSAVKVLDRVPAYYNERESYLRLAEYGLTKKIDHFWVPRLLGYDDDLLVVEMQIITNTPYIIDFAKVRIDRPPDFSKEVLRDAGLQGQELFAHHWPEVRQLLATLESFGIYYLDPQPANIVFADLRY